MVTSQKIVASFPPCAGLFGALGIGVSAAAAHLSGGGVAQIAGTFFLLHAAALLSLAGLCGPDQVRRSAATGLVLIIGTMLFCGDLALAGLFDVRPIPRAAPIGGSILIAGWLLLPLWSAVDAFRGRRHRS